MRGGKASLARRLYICILAGFDVFSTKAQHSSSHTARRCVWPQAPAERLGGAVEVCPPAESPQPAPGTASVPRHRQTAQGAAEGDSPKTRFLDAYPSSATWRERATLSQEFRTPRGLHFVLLCLSPFQKKKNGKSSDCHTLPDAGEYSQLVFTTLILL